MFRQVTVSALAAYLEAARRLPEGDGVDLEVSLERAAARQAAQARRRRTRAAHLAEESE
jgi:hypothetical protein